MSDDRTRGTSEEEHSGIPRDMPDQQADKDSPDPWDVGTGADAGEERGQDVPDADESGSERRAAQQPEGVPTDHPEPEEPAD
ncbi:hypothetical protein [Streptomyces sp. GC420]|uniref:hypothetical protein n=1 Tax=Streptomyces sp. GC420 TaxID=2697568 RepID=UPI001414EC57|nr:hypothetical protein [Streptomyces sp. GC420]NBM18367.1 hypothetical protein [Streptomyces sp. GC420]